MPNVVFCIMGPTASGKTGLACELVQQLPLEIISVDSAMIYKGMDIGTAKPTAEELIHAPHHLIDIIEPVDSYSAAQFCDEVTELCHSIAQRGRFPLLVGGTMMYFNALQKGLSTLPVAQDAIRQQLLLDAEQQGWDALYQRLKQIDPQSATRIHAHDKQRVQRALEVYYASGFTLSHLLTQQKQACAFEFVNVALFPENRPWLHERIAHRFDSMLAQGFLDEVDHLQHQWPLNPDMSSMRCVGYRQALEYLQGAIDFETFKSMGVAATRQLAKRQLTWLRNWEGLEYYECQNSNLKQQIMAKIHKIIDNPKNS